VDLAPLPYPYNALEPHIDEKTVRIHHDKHHAKYVATTKSAIVGTAVETSSNMLDIARYAKDNDNAGLYNNAAQSYNHAFYWECMRPNGGGEPTHAGLKQLIDKSFGSYDAFRKSFAAAGAGQFGSGWVWLVLNESGDLEVCCCISCDGSVASALVSQSHSHVVCLCANPCRLWLLLTLVLLLRRLTVALLCWSWTYGSTLTI